MLHVYLEPDIEELLVIKAAIAGLPVEEYAAQILRRDVDHQLAQELSADERRQAFSELLEFARSISKDRPPLSEYAISRQCIYDNCGETTEETNDYANKT